MINDGLSFDEGLVEEDFSIIKTEIDIALSTQSFLHQFGAKLAVENKAPSTMSDVWEVTNAEELAQYVDYSATGTSVALQREKSRYTNLPALENPYFGRISFSIGQRERQILIGNIAFVETSIPIPIVNWSESPLGRLFYLYAEGEEFEEDIGGKNSFGQIIERRQLGFSEGQLVSIRSSEDHYVLHNQVWTKVQAQHYGLRGGEKTSLRGDTDLLKNIESFSPRSEMITGLLDEAQFRVITQPIDQPMLISGGAGSGKTTVALHRIAYISKLAPQRFPSDQILIFAHSSPIARYFSVLLEDLNISERHIALVSDWIGRLRRRLFPLVSDDLNENTPSNVVKFKQHPLYWDLAVSVIADLINEFETALQSAVQNNKQIMGAWKTLGAQHAIYQRARKFESWLNGKTKLDNQEEFNQEWYVRERALKCIEAHSFYWDNPQELVLHVFREIFYHPKRLEKFCRAQQEFSITILQEVAEWSLKQQRLRDEYQDYHKDEPGLTKSFLDAEDEVILLLLYSKLVAPLSRKQKISYVVIDEVQECSPLELQLLTDLMKNRSALTMAGDLNQLTGREASYANWDELIGHLQLERLQLKSLAIGYRSTKPIIELAQSVLGKLYIGQKLKTNRMGEEPLLLEFSALGSAVEYLGKVLHDLFRREPNAYVGVLSRYKEHSDWVYSGLKMLGVKNLRRVALGEFAFSAGVDVAEIQQAKGLEFDYVILTDADADSFTNDPLSRRMLYVCATRAVHGLWLVSTRRRTPLLPSSIQANAYRL